MKTTSRTAAIFKPGSPEETHALGVALGQVLAAGDVVGLNGDLGAGKTLFAGGAAEGLGVLPEVPVSSPTFTLINEYPGRLLLVHMDLYRLGGADELWELGIEDYLGGAGACLIEWFERFADELDQGRSMQLKLIVDGDSSREIVAQAGDARHQALLERWREHVEKGQRG